MTEKLRVNVSDTLLSAHVCLQSYLNCFRCFAKRMSIRYGSFPETESNIS